MIPGLVYPPAFRSSGSSGLSLSLIASATNGSNTITIPLTAIAGDVAVLIDCATITGGVTLPAVTPVGWTNVANSYYEFSSNDVVRLMTSYRKLAAGDPGAVITGLNSSQEQKIMLVFRPSTSILSIVSSTWNSQGTGGDPTLQTVSASGVTAPLIVFAAAGVTSATPPTFTTETPAMTNLTASSSNLGLRVGYTIYNSGPSNQSIDIGDTESNALQSGYLRFT